MMIRRWIEVTFRKEGIHKYPAAATDPKLADVAFLSYPHRHMFHFSVRISVQHNDRDIEFIQFKRWIESLYSNSTLQLDFQSCEMLAEALIEKISKQYPGRDMEIKVFEDGENGAVLHYWAEPTI
jgi:hypothetical protein